MTFGNNRTTSGPPLAFVDDVSLCSVGVAAGPTPCLLLRGRTRPPGAMGKVIEHAYRVRRQHRLEDKVPLVDRRDFLRGVAATAAVAAVGAPRRWPRRARRGGRGRGTRTGSRPTRSASSCTPCATNSPSTSRARWPRSTTIGYTRVEHAGFVGRTVAEFKAALDANDIVSTSGHVLIPQPFDPAAGARRWPTRSTLGSTYIVHPFFGINFGTGEVVRTTAPWRAFARDLNRAGRMARDAGAEARLPQPQLGVLPADRRSLADCLRRPDRRHRPGLRAPGAGPVLGHSGRARPGGPHRAEQGPGPAVPRQGHEPGRQLHRPRSRPASTL